MGIKYLFKKERHFFAWVVSLVKYMHRQAVDKELRGEIPLYKKEGGCIMRKGNFSGGLVLILIGCLFLAAKYIFNMEFFSLGADDFWPLIVLLVGVTFELVYFVSGRAPGLLVPGGILTTQGLLFFFEVGTNWRFAEYTWPVYIFSVAIGLFQLYLYTGRKKGLLVATSILTAVGAISAITIMFSMFLGAVDLSVIIPLILIAVGLFMFFGRKTNNSSWH
jgi:hypothetical protein